MSALDDLDARFDRVRHSAFRYEGQRAYLIGGGEAARLAAWREHRPRPERSVRTDPWLARIARTTADGVEWMRLRVVDDPLTEYQRFQLTSGTYLEALAVGDRTLLLHREQAGGVLGLGSRCPDFWVLDRGTDAEVGWWMRYTSAGAFNGITMANDRDLVAMRHVADVVTRDATPLPDFLAGLESSVA